MKFKSIIVAFLFIFALTSNAQAQFSGGAGLSFPLDLGELGVFVRGDYQIDETFGAMGTFTYYLDGVEDLTFWSLDLDGTYIFLEEATLTAYALAGISLYHAGVNIDTVFGSVGGSATDFGISLGGGAKFPTGSITPFGEARLRIAGGTDFVLTAGVLFPFN